MKLPSEIRARVLEYLVCFEGVLHQVDRSEDHHLFSWCEDGVERVQTTKPPWNSLDRTTKLYDGSRKNQRSVNLSVFMVSRQL
jgi:hypothetical protein